MGSPCKLSTTGKGPDTFSPDDEPFVHFRNVVGKPARCAANVRDLQDFHAAIAANELADFAWIAADDWWNGEGAWFENNDVAYSNSRQDEFLRSTLQPLLQSPLWKNSRSLLILTWDESDGWGWPDNHVPTVLVGSPGLLHAGTVLREHVSGYDLLRTIESALRLGNLGRFDEFAQPLNEAFADARSEADATGHRLWPAGAVSTRGSIDDTFGAATTAAAVDPGQPLTLLVPEGVDESTVVSLEPLGQVPSASSASFAFDSDRRSVSIPTDGLAPGVYGAWLRKTNQNPDQAPMMVTVLAPPRVSADSPGVEILGAGTSSGTTGSVELRYGSNPIVRYCLASADREANSWIGIFPADTPSGRMTRDEARKTGYWLRTPGGGGETAPCGEAEAYAAEMSPGHTYEIVLLQTGADGATQAVGSRAHFQVIPALPEAR
jgi:hypothetical protein